MYAKTVMKTNALNVKMYDVVIFYGFETLN